MSAKLLPVTNADGLAVVPMSDAQKYLFDLKGWIALPGLLTAEQVEAVRSHQMRFLYERGGLPPAERDNHGGPSQVLLDHPAVVGVQRGAVSSSLGYRDVLRVPLRPHLYESPAGRSR